MNSTFMDISSLLPEGIRTKSYMNNKEFIAGLAERTGLSQKDAAQYAAQLVADMAFHLEEEDVLSIAGFGTFEVRTRKGREKARNPKTGELVAVDTHGVAVFRPGKELKDLVWDLRQEG